ncbi:MAG: phage tail protein [Bryobacteraceae bacterium]|nr:phage tail protein [Bryobacteraceae bacterium]MDW8378080.1 phage tail protein [Bryobacterales bacterium]
MAELVRGLKYSCGIYLRYGADGRLEACVEGPLSLQQPTKPWTSNSINPLGSGWPAYEFGDGTNGASGIVRLTSGAASIRLWSRTTADVPNRIRLEFDDEFNFYQRDSIVLSDADDLARGCGEVTWNLPALGVTNFAHAQRALQVQLRKSVRGNLYVEFDTSVKGVGLRPGDLITITYLKEGLNRKLFRVIRIIADLNMRTIHVVAQVHEDGWYEVSGSMVGGATVQPAFGNGAPRPLVGVTMNGDGETEFEVTEGATTLSDGSGMVTLSVRYHPPVRPTARSRRAPWLSLSPEIHSSGGTLSGGRILYYAISAVNQEGEEGPLSLVVSAPLGAGNSYRVVLLGISLPPDATAFHVYRGSIPQRLFRIASSVSPHDQFTDPGLSAMATGPADEHFDHANFYWRTELHPPVAVTAATRWTVSGSGMNWSTNQYRGKRVRIVSGAGAGQERTIESSNTNTLIVSSEWSILPNTSSQFVIAESNWHFGSRTQGRVAEFEVPNRGGSTVHITGRSANGAGIETEPGLAPVTRWTLGGTGGRGGDLGVPGAPLFGLSWKGKGTLELVGVSFESLTNTQSVESGTLTLFYYDELQGPPATTLAAAVSPAATTLQLSHPGGAVAGSSVQVGEEVMRVEAVTDGGWEYEVSRGQHTTTASAHAAGARVYHLNRKVFVIPFPRMFFGTPASGMFAHPIYLPMVRVASAELFVTNQVGSSPTRAIKLTGSTDYGLRTLSGGQFTIQVDGYLAIKDAIAPPLIVEDARVVRDILAVVQQAPLGAPIQLRLRKNGAVYANLTIPAGATSSNIVSGLELSPLESGSVLTLDIVSVGQTPETTPGRDLTVTIRL